MWAEYGPIPLRVRDSGIQEITRVESKTMLDQEHISR